VSRYCKFDLTLAIREGVATQTIESEDMKKAAELQIEENLKKA
jgi:hypothetical protein